MTFTIELTKDHECFVQEEAEQRNISVDDFLKDIVERGVQREKNQKAIAALRQWRVEEATDDPAEIEAAEVELKAFMRAMNENREGERILYPECE